MFSDLVGSTALSARMDPEDLREVISAYQKCVAETRMDPEDLREVISAYQKCVAETVQRFGGFVAKYMGDGVLVYFGYPQAHDEATPSWISGASSSATPTGGRSQTSTMSRSRGGARRRRRCHRRVASARADHGKLTAAVRRPPLVINRSLGRILIDTPVADKLLRHPVGAPFGSGRR